MPIISERIGTDAEIGTHCRAWPQISESLQSLSCVQLLAAFASVTSAFWGAGSAFATGAGGGSVWTSGL